LKKDLSRLKTALLRQVAATPAAPLARARRDARSSLLEFTRYTYAAYKADPAHELLAEALDAVVAGDLRRLMIFMAPQHGKSELASVRLPAYWLGRNPDAPAILCSYAASLAESKSRQARQIVEGTEYLGLFPGVTTRRDSRAVDHWELDGHRGSLLAVGVGGPVTGHGAMLGIIDDPLENWQQAQSKTVRDRCWEWYRTTFRTRIWENGAIVVVATRWHEDDLCGRLLAEQRGDWHVLRLPAVAETQAERDLANARLGLPAGQPDPLGREPGAPLCPSRYSVRELERLRADVGSLAWSGQYQGVPVAPEGNRFRRSWFTTVEAVPARAARVRYWDKASVENGGDYTVGVLMAKAAGVYYVESVIRGQWSSGQRNSVMLETAQADAARYGNTVAIWVEAEGGSGGRESAESTLRLLAGYPVHAEHVTGSKEVRVEPFAAQAEAGNVFLLRAPWNADYLDELTAFPNSKHDDQVDGSSGSFNKLSLAPVVGQPAAGTQRPAAARAADAYGGGRPPGVVGYGAGLPRRRGLPGGSFFIP
jgi:predicted phage terminase large subunit-like protein